MLEVQSNGSILEVGTLTTSNVWPNQIPTNGYSEPWLWQPYTYISSWPVYITTDKTKTAIKIYKALDTKGLLKGAKDIASFIELVEAIAAIL